MIVVTRPKPVHFRVEENFGFRWHDAELLTWITPDRCTEQAPGNVSFVGQPFKTQIKQGAATKQPATSKAAPAVGFHQSGVVKLIFTIWHASWRHRIRNDDDLIILV